MKPIIAITVICLALASTADAQKTGRDRVLKVDAVELIDHHREVEGSVDHKQQFGRYTYLFASEAHLKTFAASPERYAIQLGGACARMGALSGEGSPKIFAVHDGRLYIFASEQCKRGFLAAPEKMLAHDDPKPATNEQSIKRGRDLVERAVHGVGGAAKLDALTSYREGLSRETESGGQKYTVTDTISFLFPKKALRQETCWNEQCWAFVMVGESGWTDDSDGSEPMIAEQCTALRRGAGCHPLSLLRARSNPKMIVTSDGAKRTITIHDEGEIELELVTMHLEGATTEVGIDADGRVRLLAYRDRGPSLALGRVERVYSTFKDVGGLMLPTRVETIFDGEPVPSDSGTFAVQAVNDPADQAKFTRPVPASS